eukprot:4203690-Amphidinium_carterae.1
MFPEPELRKRTIRDQVLLVCCDCVTAHPKVLPKQHDVRRQAGEKHRFARISGEPGGPPGKRSRLL